LTNRFGTAPLTVASAYVARRERDAAIVAGSAHPLTFSGQRAATIPAGAILVSDPVSLTVPSQSDVAIDLYLPADTASSPSPLTMHANAVQTSFVSTTGDHAGAAAMPVAATTQSWFLLARVEVINRQASGAVVVFGDSISDGTRSTADTNSRWPDHLARRIVNQAGVATLGVANAAIAGNRLMSEALPPFGINALARFEEDVLMQPGTRYVVVMEGINDIGMAPAGATPTVAEIIAAHRQLIERAHTWGLKIYGATLTPYEGAAYFKPQGETIRQGVNQWLRSGGGYDGVIDFDALIRDAAAPSKMDPRYDSGDHLHPNDAGYAAMGNAVDLKLFTGGPGTR
jgi:lysophospholipase L1-like esterase